MNLAEATPQLTVVDLAGGLRDVSRRPVIVEGLLMRGVVTFVTGRGGTAKSQFAQQVALMVTSGRPWAHWEPRTAGSALIINGEDDIEEQRRRLAAAAEAQVEPRAEALFSVDAAGIVMFELDEESARPTATAMFKALEREVGERRPDVLILDPLVETHTLDENNNGHMAHVVAALRRLARRANCAVLVVHHGRKGATAGDQDGARGASALINAARSAITLEPMSAEDAARLLPKSDCSEPWRFIRVTDSKQNYAPRLGDRWLRLASIPHPNGDVYPALTMPRMRMAPDANAVLTFISSGEYSLATRGKTEGRLDAELAQHFDIAPQEARTLVDQLIKDGCIRSEARRQPNGKSKQVAVIGSHPQLPLPEEGG